MSVSGIRAAESNRDERRLGATGGQQVNAEELLAELVQLVESSALGPGHSPLPAEPAPEPDRTDAGPQHPPEMTSRLPSVEAPAGGPSETGAADVEPPRESDYSYSSSPYAIDSATRRRSKAWLLTVSALVLAGAAGVGSMFWFKADEPALPKAAAFIAATPTAQPGSDSAVATSSDAAAAPVGDVPQPAPVKTVSPEERPTDLGARASLDDAPLPAGSGSTATGAAQPAAGASAGSLLAAPVNPPAATAGQNAASPPMASQSPDSGPVPAVLPATTPAQIATPAPSAADSGRAAHASDAPLPPVRRAKKAASEAPGVLHRSTPTPARLSGEPARHVAVAKAEATAAGAPVETPSESLRRAPVKPAKGASPLNAAEAPAEAQAAPPGPPQPAQQSNPNPVAHAFSSVVGALNGLNPFATH